MPKRAIQSGAPRGFERSDSGLRPTNGVESLRERIRALNVQSLAAIEAKSLGIRADSWYAFRFAKDGGFVPAGGLLFRVVRKGEPHQHSDAYCDKAGRHIELVQSDPGIMRELTRYTAAQAEKQGRKTTGKYQKHRNVMRETARELGLAAVDLTQK